MSEKLMEERKKMKKKMKIKTMDHLGGYFAYNNAEDIIKDAHRNGCSLNRLDKKGKGKAASRIVNGKNGVSKEKVKQIEQEAISFLKERFTSGYDLDLFVAHVDTTCEQPKEISNLNNDNALNAAKCIVERLDKLEKLIAESISLFCAAGLLAEKNNDISTSISKLTDIVLSIQKNQEDLIAERPKTSEKIDYFSQFEKIINKDEGNLFFGDKKIDERDNRKIVHSDGRKFLLYDFFSVRIMKVNGDRKVCAIKNVRFPYTFDSEIEFSVLSEKKRKEIEAKYESIKTQRKAKGEMSFDKFDKNITMNIVLCGLGEMDSFTESEAHRRIARYFDNNPINFWVLSVYHKEVCEKIFRLGYITRRAKQYINSLDY